MALLNLRSLEHMIQEFDLPTYIQAGSPTRHMINFEDAVERAKGRPIRFSIRVPKYALSSEQLSCLFQNIRRVFTPEEQCTIMNAGDSGVSIEGCAEAKHKALIALWELGVYNFQFTYKYGVAREA